MVRSTSSQNLEEQGSSSISPLLSTASLSEKDTLDEGNEHHVSLLRFSPTLLILTFLVVLVTSGLGVTMIFWFFTHTHQGGLIEIWKEGVFLLDEGIENGGVPGVSKAGRLSGLTMATVAVSSIPDE